VLLGHPTLKVVAMFFCELFLPVYQQI